MLTKYVIAIAKIQPSQNCNIDIDFVLDIGAFDLKNALTIDPQFLEEDAHEHDATVASIAISNEGIVNGDKLNRWLNQLVQAIGQDIFRMKGILNVDNEDRRFVFQDFQHEVLTQNKIIYFKIPE